jgi:hypothetical protein
MFLKSVVEKNETPILWPMHFFPASLAVFETKKKGEMAHEMFRLSNIL